jgi:hypothetical protein
MAGAHSSDPTAESGTGAGANAEIVGKRQVRSEENLERCRALLEGRVLPEHGTPVNFGSDEEHMVGDMKTSRRAVLELGSDRTIGEVLVGGAVLHADPDRVGKRARFAGAE